MLLFDVTRDFDKAVEEKLVLQPELLIFIKNHERRGLVLANLCHQILTYEKKFKSRVSATNRKLLIDQVASFFITAAVEQRKQANWTEAQKSVERNKDSLKNDVASLIKEVPNASEEKTVRQE